MENFEIDTELNEITQRIIAERFPELEELSILTLLSDREKKSKYKKTYAECIKQSDLQHYLTGHDYIIVVYEPNTALLSLEQLEILLTHELMHIDYTDGEKGIKPHDIEEFRAIIDEFGIDWTGAGG